MRHPLDPAQRLELAALRKEHQERFQTTIDYIKQRVGPGVEYRNDVVRVVISDNGAYFELLDLPVEFAGAAGGIVDRQFVTSQYAIEVLTNAAAALPFLTDSNCRRLSIFAVYSQQGLLDPTECYMLDVRGGDHPSRTEIGTLQEGVLPLFYKLKVDADLPKEASTLQNGLLFCMASAGDRHLMAHIPLSTEPYVDLTERSATILPQ